MNSLWCVHTNEADSLLTPINIHDQSVAVHDASNGGGFGRPNWGGEETDQG